VWKEFRISLSGWVVTSTRLENSYRRFVKVRRSFLTALPRKRTRCEPSWLPVDTVSHGRRINKKQHGRENLKCRILCADLVMFYYSFKETYSWSVSWDGYTCTVPEGRRKTVQQYRRIASLGSRIWMWRLQSTKQFFFPPGGERASTRRNVSATRRFALQCLVDMIRYADSLAGVRCRWEVGSWNT
jgi:hypothetical protein